MVIDKIRCSTQKQQVCYEDYIKLITFRAWSWSKRTGWDFQELMAEGNLVYAKIISGFDSNKSCFGTYLYNGLQIHFGNLTRMKWRPERAEIELDQIPHFDNPEQKAALGEMIERLSKDARTLVECTLETPQDLIWMLGQHGKAVRITHFALLKYFRQKRGWSIPRYQSAVRTIQIALNSL